MLGQRGKVVELVVVARTAEPQLDVGGVGHGPRGAPAHDAGVAAQLLEVVGGQELRVIRVEHGASLSALGLS